VTPVPLATVVIPTYNYAHFIGDAIDSVLNQTTARREIETIVVDDGSDDATYETVKRYGDGILYVGQANMGKAMATRVGIENARGKYIFNLDGDDMFRARRIEAALAVFERNERIVHVAHPAVLWNENLRFEVVESVPAEIKNKELDGKELLAYFYRRKILFGGGSTFAARAHVLKSIPITAAMDMCIDEYLVMWMLNAGRSFFLEEPLSVWRIHGGNFSAQTGTASVDRVQRGTEAVLASVLNHQFEREIKALYLLKTKVARVAAKEASAEKSWRDVMDLWLWVIQHRRLFGVDLWRIIKRYTLLKRSLPTPLLHFAKRLARRGRGGLHVQGSRSELTASGESGTAVEAWPQGRGGRPA
jgi:glycosyltransferase involved in cell wall biosynthesis